ncbi:MAG: bifunctional fructose-bisphosphatase/inositol-phosphate phosphatase [Methanosphaera sp.]|nr:bifunctional fructose-bisphosphatase/inositol-phosphate phosphatase [Methanosphaera sp.]
MNDEEINYWLDMFDKISQSVEEAIINARQDPDVTNITKMGADGTPTHKIDEYAEKAALDMIESSGKSLIVISEEIGTLKVGDDMAEYVIVMDPLDGTSNAMKNIPCYGISLALAPISGDDLSNVTLEDIEVGYVKNFSISDVYRAVKGRGATKNDEKMNISSITRASDSTLCTYIYRAKPGVLDKLCSSVRRMRLIGAIAVELCYVADGTYDVFLDIGQVRVLDIAASQLIIKENGGLITDRNKMPLKSRLDLIEKTSIIATTNKELQEDVLQLID